MDLPIKIVIGGLGVRGYEVYASYAKRNPDKMQVTAIAEPNPIRRRDVQREIDIIGAQVSEEKVGAMVEERLRDEIRRGVQTIFQQPALLPNLSVAEKPACAGSMVWRLILPENTARSSSSRKMHRALLLTLPNASVNLESISHSCVCSANPKEIPLIPS